MQAQESEKQFDETLNFRPSPNFKHKKYLRSKFEEDQNGHKLINKRNKDITVVQPPLPPNSPPPHSPITLKQEVEDDGYECAGLAYAASDSPPAPPEAAADAEASPGDKADEADADDAAASQPAGGKSKFVMCKDWVRGTCTRGLACIYVHELDKSQLKGVYRFCRDFENNCCSRQVCYFVHATTFEKEHFHRTGQLPPHALQHLKAAAPAQRGQKPLMPVCVASNPPPPPALATGSVAPAGPAGAAAAGAAAGEEAAAGAAAAAGAYSLDTRSLLLDAFAAAALPGVALKRKWNDQNLGSPPRVVELESQPLPKKCKNCDITALRLENTKAQIAAARRDSQELDHHLERAGKNIERLQALLTYLFKPKRVLEHANSAFLERDRLAALGGENKDIMKVLLAKLLLGGKGKVE